MSFNKLQLTVKRCKASIINKNIQNQEKHLGEVLKKIDLKKKEIVKKEEIIEKTNHEIISLNEKANNISKTIQKSSGLEQDTLNSEISSLKQEVAGMIARKENFENQLVELDRNQSVNFKPDQNSNVNSNQNNSQLKSDEQDKFVKMFENNPTYHWKGGIDTKLYNQMNDWIDSYK